MNKRIDTDFLHQYTIDEKHYCDLESGLRGAVVTFVSQNSYGGSEKFDLILTLGEIDLIESAMSLIFTMRLHDVSPYSRTLAIDKLLKAFQSYGDDRAEAETSVC